MKKLTKCKLKFNPLLAFSFLMATLFLLVCSKSSPLYPMNDWVDVNCFFTVGKSILHGIVPYAELYEQKGPVLYFMYAIAALISDQSFFGVFLLEVVTFGLFLYFSGKIAEIYLGKTSLIYFILAFLAMLIPISKAFAHGGGCEELCLFMLTYSLYSVLLALHEKRTLTFKEAFINGISPQRCCISSSPFWASTLVLQPLCCFGICWTALSGKSSSSPSAISC